MVSLEEVKDLVSTLSPLDMKELIVFLQQKIESSSQQHDFERDPYSQQRKVSDTHNARNAALSQMPRQQECRREKDEREPERPNTFATIKDESDTDSDVSSNTPFNVHVEKKNAEDENEEDDDDEENDTDFVVPEYSCFGVNIKPERPHTCDDVDDDDDENEDSRYFREAFLFEDDSYEKCIIEPTKAKDLIIEYCHAVFHGQETPHFATQINGTKFETMLYFRPEKKENLVCVSGSGETKEKAELDASLKACWYLTLKGFFESQTAGDILLSNNYFRDTTKHEGKKGCPVRKGDAKKTLASISSFFLNLSYDTRKETSFFRSTIHIDTGSVKLSKEGRGKTREEAEEVAAYAICEFLWEDGVLQNLIGEFQPPQKKPTLAPIEPISEEHKTASTKSYPILKSNHQIPQVSQPSQKFQPPQPKQLQTRTVPQRYDFVEELLIPKPFSTVPSRESDTITRPGLMKMGSDSHISAERCPISLEQAKNTLQQYYQTYIDAHDTPSYTTVRQGSSFVCTATVRSIRGNGSAQKKSEAEKKAALAVCQKLWDAGQLQKLKLPSIALATGTKSTTAEQNFASDPQTGLNENNAAQFLMHCKQTFIISDVVFTGKSFGAGFVAATTLTLKTGREVEFKTDSPFPTKKKAKATSDLQAALWIVNALHVSVPPKLAQF